MPKVRISRVDVSEINRAIVSLDDDITRVTELLDQLRAGKIAFTGDLDLGGYRATNAGTSESEDDLLTGAELSDRINDIEDEETALETSEAEEYGGGAKARRKARRTSRLKAIAEESALASIADAVPTVAPPEVEDASALGTTDDSPGPVLFALSDHTHSGINLGDAQTITGAKTFDLDPAAPFIVTAGSAKVANLDSDLLDGLDSLQFLRSDTSDAFTSGTLTINAATTLSVAGTFQATETGGPTLLTLAAVADGEIFTRSGTNIAGSTLAALGASIKPHNFLDVAEHNNTATGLPVQGDLIVANATPAWDKLTVGVVNTVLVSNGTTPGWSATLAGLTLTTPTIADFTNAQHDHSNAAGGGAVDHTSLSSIGTNTHAQIDTHIADSTIHFTEASIDHGSIGGLTDDDHTQYILVDGTRAFTAYIDIDEAAVPGTPAANTVRIYAEDFHGFPFLSFKDDGGQVRKLVRDSVFLAYNNRGTTIALGRIVYATGAFGDVPTIDTAKADSSATMPAIGVTIESIANNAYGRVMQVGLLENVNTSAYAAGDVLYVSETTAGVPTATPPVYPNLRQEIGTILISDASVGAIQLVARTTQNDGVVDHGGLLGTADDDHTQYLLLAGRAGGQTAIGGTGSGDDLTLQSTSDPTKGSLILDDTVSVWPSLTATTATNVIDFAPTTTLTGTLTCIRVNPLVTTSGLAAQVLGVNVGGIYTASATANTILFCFKATGYTSSSTAAQPPGSVYVLDNQTAIDATGSVDVGTVPFLVGVQNTPHISAGSGSTITLTNLYGLFDSPGFLGAGTKTITNRQGVRITDLSAVGGGSNTLVNNIGVYIDDLTTGTTLNVSLQSVGASVPMYHAGPITSGNTASANLTLQSTDNVTRGEIRLDDVVKLSDSYTGGSRNLIVFDPTITIGASTLTGFVFSPTATVNNLATVIFAMHGAGVYTQTGSNILSAFQLFTATPVLTSATAATPPMDSTIFNNKSTIISTGSAAVGTIGFHRGFWHHPIISALNTSSLTLTELTGMYDSPTISTDTIGGSITVSTRRALYIDDVVKSGAGTETLTNNIAIDIAALTASSLNISLRSAGSSTQMRHAGPAVFGANAGVTGGNAAIGLEVQSTTKTLLLSRLTTTQRNAIATPLVGMVIYNTTTGNVEAYTTTGGPGWVAL